MKTKFLIVLVFICSFGFAQSYKGSIENVKENGFHKIEISSEIRAASQDNLDYFRKATTDTGISLIASDLIISCRTKKVKQYGGCAELCASLF